MRACTMELDQQCDVEERNKIVHRIQFTESETIASIDAFSMVVSLIMIAGALLCSDKFLGDNDKIEYVKVGLEKRKNSIVE
jgi:hypothetical protein